MKWKQQLSLGDRVSAVEGCETAVTVRTKCGSVKFRECSELLYRRFPLMLTAAVHNSCVMLAIMKGSEAWCLNESNMGILFMAERSIVRSMCRVQLKDRKQANDLMLSLDETIDLLAMGNSGMVSMIL